MPSLVQGSLIGGRYRLENPLAQGGMGALWVARHLQLDVLVAVKLMAPALGAAASGHERFEREARSAARLRSPHVVQVLDYGIDDGAPYIVMELLQGEDLASRLGRTGSLSLAATAGIVVAVAKALSLAHEEGIVHRDLKPANVFLCRQGDEEIVKVLDFGIAKVEHGESGSALTSPGLVMGSPHYMSPEQARGLATVDHRADLWSLAVIAYQCLTGRLPFASENLVELIVEICHGPFPAASGLVPELPGVIDRFFERAFLRPSEERFQSARELAEQLALVAGPPSSRAEALTTPLVRSPRRRPSEGAGGGGDETPAGAGGDAASLALFGIAGPPKTVADRFDLERLAGRGGMGAVFRARDRANGGLVALKLLHEAQVDRERFVREALLLSELSHPGIVRYVAHGAAGDGRLYLAMEWLEGNDLATRIARGKLGVAEAVAVTHRAAEALGAAHRRGVVHRDIKPSNLFLPGDDTARTRVIDFGIARGAAGRTVDRTRAGLMYGTPGYMAPEQVRGDVDVDARADVFAMGCVLFECLTGRAPFAGETALAAMAKAVSQPAPRASALVAGVPPEIDALIARLLAKAREDRPSDGASLAAELAAVTLRPGTAGTPGSATRATITTTERKLACAVLVVPVSASGAPLVALESANVEVGATSPPEEPTWTVHEDTMTAAQRLAPIAQRFGGRSEVLASGAIAILFEGGGAAAEHATRAALAALDFRESGLRAAVAVATGRRAVIARGASDVLERAAKALAAAPAHEATSAVILDETTAGLLDARFAIERGAWGHVLRHLLDAAGEERRLLGKTTPCAGREPELSMLDALFRECEGESIAKAAILKGSAGSGKSRVRQELLRRLRERNAEVEVWIGRGDVMSAGSPFAILTRAISGALGLSGGEPEAERAERLRERVAARVAAADVARVALFLGDLMGIASGEAPPELLAAREDAILLGDQRRRAFEDFVAGQCRARPLLLVLEDLHWGDLPTVKLVDAALRALVGSPLFVLATARPDLDDLFPKLWEERVPQEIRLGPISPKAAEKIVRHVLGKEAAPELVARVVTRAAGHPLHLEEILRVVALGRGDELPDTALAMVEARLDALDPGARRVLRAASVFGRTFWEGGVAALTAGRAEDQKVWLAELVAREWIAKTPRSRFARETEYVFQQDLIHEAAYAMLPEADRALGHRLAGEWLEGEGERDSVVLARHFELGGEAALAARFYLRAAEQGLDAGDFASAAAHAERVAALPSDAAYGARARAVQAEAHLHRGEIEAARARGLEAVRLLGPTEHAFFRAMAAVTVASGKLGDIATVQANARELLGLSPGGGEVLPFAAATSATVVQLVIGGDMAGAATLHAKLEAVVAAAARPEPAARGHVARAGGARAAFSGDLFGSIECLRSAVAAFEAAGDLRTTCSMQKTLGWYLGECGALEEAEASLRESLLRAERLGLTNLAPHAKHDLGSPLLRLGKLAEARRFQEEAIVAFQAQGDRRLESGAHAMVAQIAIAEGDLEAAEREVQLALGLATSAPLRFTALAVLARIQLDARRFADAVATADGALASLAETGSSEEGVVTCQLARAEALFALGEAAPARATLERARAEILARAERIRDPALRRSFLERIPENARVLTLAERGFAPALDHGHDPL